MCQRRQIHSSRNQIAGAAYQSFSPITLALVAILAVAVIFLISTGAANSGVEVSHQAEQAVSASQESNRPPLFVPGSVPPSGCRVGAVMSTDQFDGNGISDTSALTINGSAESEFVAGFWVIANNYLAEPEGPNPPNCRASGTIVDGNGLNLMAVRLYPTAASGADADVLQIKLVLDRNLNGQFDADIDEVLQSQPGSELDTEFGVTFKIDSLTPIAALSNSEAECAVGIADASPAAGFGPAHGINSTDSSNGCFAGLLAVVTTGAHSQTGIEFGLELGAISGDVPGSNGANAFTFSSAVHYDHNSIPSNRIVTF